MRVLRQAREAAEWGERLLARLDYVDASEHARVRRAVVGGRVRAVLVPAQVTGAARVLWPVGSALVGVGVGATALALVASLGLLPDLVSVVVVSGRRVSLALAVAGAACVGLLAVPTWPRILREAREIRDSLRGKGSADLEQWARVLTSVAIAAGAVAGMLNSALIVSGPGWGAHGELARALVCGLAAGVSGHWWDRWAFSAAERLLGDRPRERPDDRALHALFVCACVSGQILDGEWRMRSTVKAFRSFLASYAAYARSTQAVAGQTRWFEWRERAVVRRRYRMLAELIEEHGNAVLAARTRADWERVCQSLVSGLVLLTDGDWDALLARHASLARRERWIVRHAPRLTTALVTGAAAALLPLLPGVSSSAGSSIRVFLGVGTVLALLPGAGSYDSVRGALSSSLGWKPDK